MKIAFAVVTALWLAGCAPKPATVRIGVGGQNQLVYLPATLAKQLGYFTEEGVSVELQEFSGGAKALEALMGGSVDVVSGFYDHTIQMAAEGKPLRAFVTMLRYSGNVAVVSPASKKVARIEDWKGATVGVSAPGSSTHLFAKYLAVRHGLGTEDFSAVGIGLSSGSVAAMERGKVDAAIMTDPALAQLEKRAGKVVILADTRTAQGVKDAFGTETYPASVLYTKPEWINGHTEAARKLAHAIRRTLQWMQAHSPEEIASKMPAEARGDDPALYTESIRRCFAMYSPDGKMPPDGPAAVHQVLSVTLEKVRTAKVNLANTYTNEFVD